MDIPQTLQFLGLHHNEAMIYAALLEKGPMLIAPLGRKTGIHRPSIYKALERLQREKLVTKKIKGKQNFYVAENQKHLEQKYHHFQQDFAEGFESLKSLGRSTEGIKTENFYGVPGLRKIMSDLVYSLRDGETFYRYSSRQASKDKDIEKYLPKNYRLQRDKKKIEQFVITNAHLKDTPYKKRLECASKIMPDTSQKTFNYNVSLLVYADKIAYIDFSQGVGIMIQHARLASFHKHIFLSLYHKLT